MSGLWREASGLWGGASGLWRGISGLWGGASGLIAGSGGIIPPPPFSPADLFLSSEQGAWYDPSDLSTMWSDTAGTVPAVIDGPVARIDDKSGRGNFLIQATAAAQPILRSAGGLFWLEFDGVDDGLHRPAADMSASDKVTAWAGIRKLTDANPTAMLEFTNTPASNNGGFGFLVPLTSAAATASFRSRGTVAVTATGAVAPSPVTLILTGIGDISAPMNTIRANGVVINSLASSQGTGNYANSSLNLGRRAGGIIPFPGRVYGVIIRGGNSTAQQITDTEAWLLAKTGPVGVLDGFDQGFNSAPALVYSAEDRTVTRTDAVGRRAVRGRTGHVLGKWYVELEVLVERLRFGGIVDATYATNGGGGPAGTNRCGLQANQLVFFGGSGPGGGFALPGDIIRVAYDATSDLFWFRQNLEDWNNDPLADPVAGIGGLSTAGLVGNAYVGVTLRPVVGAGVHYRLPGDPGYTLPAGFAEWAS